MSNVNLNLYRIFCKVAESKSYSEAAEKLNLTVSNVSTQISNLESQLDLKLFNRETKGVTLTEEGQELYEIVNKSISSFDFAEKLAKDKNNIDKGIVKIGCPSHYTNYYLMDKIEKAKEEHPNLEVIVLCELDKTKMINMLKNHEIDFIISDINFESENIVIKEIKTMQNIFVSKTPITITNIKELEQLNCILNFESSKTTKELKELLKQYDVNLTSTFACDATENRVEAVKRNFGIGYVIKDSVNEELNNKELYEVKLPIELPKVKLNLIYIKDEISKVGKEFIKEYLK